jgi:putative oxidoreductase
VVATPTLVHDDAILPSRRFRLSRNRAIAILRITVAGIFMAHAIVRIIKGTIPGFGGFLERTGFPAGVELVWAITAFEVIGGALLAMGRWTRLLSAGFAFILVVGIVIIHWRLGWFVGEHGNGGSEYSVALLAALLVIAADDESRSS